MSARALTVCEQGHKCLRRDSLSAFKAGGAHPSFLWSLAFGLPHCKSFLLVYRLPFWHVYLVWFVKDEVKPMDSFRTQMRRPQVFLSMSCSRKPPWDGSVAQIMGKSGSPVPGLWVWTGCTPARQVGMGLVPPRGLFTRTHVKSSLRFPELELARRSPPWMALLESQRKWIWI